MCTMHDIYYGMVHYMIVVLNVLERFSFEYRKTKTKVINPTNHNRREQHKGPIRT